MNFSRLSRFSLISTLAILVTISSSVFFAVSASSSQVQSPPKLTIPPAEIDGKRIVALNKEQIKQDLKQNTSLIEGAWSINANGFTGALIISSVSANGALQGSLFGDRIEGFWDSRSQKITFLRVPPSGNPSSIQVYTGFLFQDPQKNSVLTGFFEAFAGTGATAERTLFGWFAQR